MNYIKIFQNAQALLVAVGNSSSEDQLMHTFINNFRQGGKYSTQIANHQAELRREETFTDEKSLSIPYLQTDYLNLDIISGCGRNSEREKMFIKSALFVEVLITLQKNVSKGSEGKNKKPVRLVIWTTDKQSGLLENVLDVDLKTT